MHKKAFFVLFFVVFFNATGFGLVFPLFSAMLFDPDGFLLDPSVSDTVRGLWLGILLSTAPIVQMLVSPYFGKLSDRFGRKPLILFCLSVGFVAYLFAAHAVEQVSLYGLFVSRIGIGIPFATFGLANAVIADISTESDRGRKFAWINSAYGSGFAVGPLLGGLLASDRFFGVESFARPFYISSLLLLTALFLVIICVPETRKKENITSNISIFSEVRNLNKRILKLLLATFLFFFGWSFYIELIPVWWMAHFELAAEHVGLMFAYASFWLVATCSFMTGPLLKRINPLLLFEIAALLLFVCLWIMFIFNSEIVYLFELALQNVFAGILYPVTATAVSTLSDGKNQGKIMGIYAGVQGFGLGLSPLTSGLFVGFHVMMPVALGGLFVFFSWVYARRVRKIA